MISYLQNGSIVLTSDSNPNVTQVLAPNTSSAQVGIAWSNFIIANPEPTEPTTDDDEIATLQTQVATLQAQVATLQTQIANAQPAQVKA